MRQPWAPKTMKNKGFGQLKTRLFTTKTSKNVGLGGPWNILVPWFMPSQKAAYAAWAKTFSESPGWLPGLCAVAVSAARNRSRGKHQTARQGKDKEKEDPTKMKWVDGWMVRSVKFQVFFGSRDLVGLDPTFWTRASSLRPPFGEFNVSIF